MQNQKKNKIEDITRFCSRCGISFLWTAEEQTAAFALGPELVSAPEVCAGCRALLPATGRERGLVKWYHQRKGYGFIVRRGQPDLYVHRSALPNSILAPGVLVEFTIGANEQGPVAEAVTVLAEPA